MSTDIKNQAMPFTRSIVDILRETFQGRREKNTSYSMSSFARDLGISKSLLSRIFNGERPVSLQMAMQIVTALDISEAQSKKILLSVLRNSSKNAKISKKMRTQIEKEAKESPEVDATPLFTTVEIERFKAMASWQHLAILNLTRVKGFKNDPVWIAKRLGITSIEAQDGLERLLSIGLLYEQGEQLTRTTKSLNVKTHKSEFAVRKFHEQMIGKAQDELKKTSEEDFQKRLINGITFPCDSEHIELIKEKINKLQDEILTLVTGERESLYQMNVQFFPLTKQVGE